MKTFPPGQFRGAARIAGGQLRLDGKTAYAIVSSPPRPQSMFFQGRGLGGQWDTWLYFHRGTYYLFILAGSGGHWHGISMARSADGVTWEDLGMVIRKDPGVTWLGTGSTWKSPRFERDGKFFLNYSQWRGDRQTIFFAESKDLLRWTPLGPDFEFKQDDRWYKPKGRWDCIYTIPREGGGLYGYWTADPKSGPGVGFGQATDGVHWEALPPPPFVDGAPHGECGAVEKIGQKYYMMLGTGGKMVTLTADKPPGPFRPARTNFCLLSGQTYFARFLPMPGALLVNHHSMSREGVFSAPLKRAVVNDQGVLRLKWWAGNDALKREPVRIEPPPAQPAAGAVRLLPTQFDPHEGLVLEGVVDLPPPAADAPPGVYLEHAGGAMAVRVLSGGAAEIGTIRPDGSAFIRKDGVDRQLGLTGTVRFRLLLKRCLLEFYLDDHLINCWSLPQRSSGHVGLLGSASVTGAWYAQPAR